ncbi:MAG: epoxide hydrolase [Elusimicrobiales bacterium]|nr:epoxide hydrolase [Elusimicrobiales bacterium]
MNKADIAPFSVKIPDNEINDLRRRLKHTRLPDTLDASGWKYGTDRDFIKRFLAELENFDWRTIEGEINAQPQFLMKQKRADIHFIHMKSGSPRAVPLLLCHGWPSSFLEMMELGKLLSSLPDSGAPGNLTFDVIIPSLPGFGFSKPKLDGTWDLCDYSDSLFQLMSGLGYERFAVHAYDVAASMISFGAFRFPERIIAYHTTEPGLPPPFLGDGAPPLTQDEAKYIKVQQAWDKELGAYMPLFRTKPQTAAYGLADSPAATAAWILEKWRDWTDPERLLEECIPLEHLLAQVSLYWFTNSFNSANRVYLRDEKNRPWLRTADTKVSVPVGVTLNATQPIEHAPREYAARIYSDIRYWKQLAAGGHFSPARNRRCSRNPYKNS